MGEVFLICGKLCSGKTTYAHKLAAEQGAVLLSVDEVMLSIFGQFAGDKHDEYAAGAKRFLLGKAVELADKNVPVVLDWGFWSRAERQQMRVYFAARGVVSRLVYLAVEETVWKQRILARNTAVLAGDVQAYYVDDNLAKKFLQRFEEPADEEIDLRVTCG